jgi:outer membrane protein
MKNISIVINIVLAALLGFAFYQIHSLKKKVNGEVEEVVSTNDTAKKVTPTISVLPSKLPEGKIAYINVDTLDLKYDYFKDFSKSFAARKGAIESQMESQAAVLEKEYGELQQAAQAGIRSQADLEKDQQKLIAKKQSLDAQQGRLQSLASEMADKQLEVRKDLAAYLAKFNAGRYDYILPYSGALTQTLYVNPSLDITSQVIAGLNAEYNAKKKK